VRSFDPGRFHTEVTVKSEIVSVPLSQNVGIRDVRKSVHSRQGHGSFRPNLVVQAGVPGPRKQPFVKRDLFGFSVSDMPFQDRAIWNRFGKAGTRDDRCGGLLGSCSAIGSFVGTADSVQLIVDELHMWAGDAGMFLQSKCL
jgi:hypothetical protein